MKAERMRCEVTCAVLGSGLNVGLFKIQTIDPFRIRVRPCWCLDFGRMLNLRS